MAETKTKAKAPRKARAKASNKARNGGNGGNGANLDPYGFKLGSTRGKAAALYAKGKGATLHEVKEACGSVQYNVLNSLKARGFVVEGTAVKGPGKRPVTRYKVRAGT